jgi:hypothetical protein
MFRVLAEGIPRTGQCQMLANASLASALGRPDLAMWASTQGVVNMQPPPVSAGNVLAGGYGGAGGVNVEGRASAGLIGLLVLAVVGFYVWTRGFQASGG